MLRDCQPHRNLALSFLRESDSSWLLFGLFVLLRYSQSWQWHKLWSAFIFFSSLPWIHFIVADIFIAARQHRLLHLWIVFSAPSRGLHYTGTGSSSSSSPYSREESINHNGWFFHICIFQSSKYLIMFIARWSLFFCLFSNRTQTFEFAEMTS